MVKYYLGLVAVAAPIREQDGRVVGAISVSGPSTRLNNKELIRIGDLIVSEIDAVQARSKKKPQMPNQKIGKVGAARHMTRSSRLSLMKR